MVAWERAHAKAAHELGAAPRPAAAAAAAGCRRQGL